MRILSVHNQYQIRGGEDECFAAEVALLREMDHAVDVFEESNDRVTSLGKLQTAARTLWSQESYQTAKRQLTQFPYDIVHVHNFFPLISPAIYYAAQASHVPVVQTLHNYRLLCPNAQFFREGKPCEDCLGKLIPLPGVVHGCYRESAAATAVVTAMISGHRLLKTWTNKVNLYIALTEFAREKFIEGGLPAEKIVVKPNFVNPDPGVGKGEGQFAIFVGRLSAEKGIGVLLTAWQTLGKHIPLKIVGDGPLAPQVAAAAQQPGVEWLGRRSLQEVYQLMGEASFLVFPSEWYEGLPRTLIEAFAVGTPAIASNLGAMSTLVKAGYNGLHFTPGSSDSLIAQVEWLRSHPLELAEMRLQARAEYEAKYTAKANYEQLIKIYKLANQR